MVFICNCKLMVNDELRLAVSSLTEIQYLQNEPSLKGAHANESVMLETKYFFSTESSDEQSAFDGL